MYYTKVIIPTYTEYIACQFTIDNLEKFKSFISADSYNLEITYKQFKDKQIPTYASFKWNPYGVDYPETINISNNQWFFIDVNDKEHYMILDSKDFQESWYIHET